MFEVQIVAACVNTMTKIYIKCIVNLLLHVNDNVNHDSLVIVQWWLLCVHTDSVHAFG